MWKNAGWLAFFSFVLVVIGAFAMGAGTTTTTIGGPMEFTEDTASSSDVSSSGWAVLGDEHFILGDAIRLVPGIITLEVYNEDDTDAITDFEIQTRAHEDATWFTWLSDDDFDSWADEWYDHAANAYGKRSHPLLANNLYWVTAVGPHELAATGKANVIFPISGQAIRFRTKVDGDETDNVVSVKFCIIPK